MHGVSTASELAVSSGEAGSARPGEKDTTNADVTAVARPAGEARPPGIAKQSATTKPELAESSGEAGSPWSRAGDTTNTDFTAAAAVKSVGEARPPRFVK